MYTSRVNGAVWKEVGQVLMLQSCPPGYLFVNTSGGTFAAEVQECYYCEALTYSTNPTDGCERVNGKAACNGSVSSALRLAALAFALCALCFVPCALGAV